MRKLSGFIVVALISVLWRPAFGQDYRNFDVELNEIRSGARLRFGPLRFIPEFRLMNIGYDDNVYFRSADEKAVGDYTGTVSPEVRSYLLLGRSLILSLSENPEYLYFTKETRLRRFTNSFAPGARLRLFNRIALSGRYHFEKHQRRALSEFTSLVTDTDKGIDLAAFYETPRGSAIGVSRAVDRFQYEDIVLPDSKVLLSRSLNRKETTGNIEFYYPVFAESFFFVTAGATIYEFDDPSFRWRNSRSYQTSAGIRFPLVGRATGRLSLGYKKFTPDSKDRRAFSGLIADTDIDFRLGRIGLRAGLGRDNHFSYIEDAFFYVEDQVRSGLSFRLNRRFRLDYELRNGWLRYSEPLPVDGSEGAGPEIFRKDVHRSHKIGLTIFFLRQTGIQLSYNIYDQTSNTAGFDRKKNFIGLSLTRDF